MLLDILLLFPFDGFLKSVEKFLKVVCGEFLLLLIGRLFMSAVRGKKVGDVSPNFYPSLLN